MASNDDLIELKNAQTDKELKKAFKKIASKDPNSYFPTKELKNLGYMRKLCSCGTNFWTTHKDREVCGDPACSGSGFQVVIDNPSTIKLSYIEVWKKIVEILEPRGYKPIKRYPCVARWNPTSEFTIASISAFQPYVITGEVEPPAKKLIIPQFCLRFNDIENVGITSSHCTGFVMIGQHSFVPPEEWHQGELFMDMHDFITIGVGLSKDEITIHEDSWAGGGSFGCSLEFFSRGVELFNQVYTMFEQTPEGPRELKLKVLDMGLGQERVAWFSQGTPNLYEATFPFVLKKLRVITKIELDLGLYNKFSQYSAYLNLDEVEDIDEAWQQVAEKLKTNVKTLKKKIEPMTALYSIAEHARSLLFAIHDGKLPSNVGGGYNLRVIFRRAISFIDKFKWNIDMADICVWHADELKELFPEVSEHLDEIKEILNVEREKYYATKEKATKILDKILQKGDITTETLIELYDSNGISPDMVKESAKKYKIKIKIPDDFYSLVVERHDKVEQIHATGKEIELNLTGIPETKSLYYDDYTKMMNEAKVLKIIDNMVVLDQSIAYPTSGGQLHDIGRINGQKFIDVFKQGNHIIHILEKSPKFKAGDKVKIEVDEEWRKQLAQHHTATHIVNAAAREILGAHINQAGAKKTLKSSHLDITHYEQIPLDKLIQIEKRANEIVKKSIDLHSDFIVRSEAEKLYGMSIYQGGAVPGKYIRIIEVPGIDVEACGGTHLNNTSETGEIKIIKSQKIQDGIVRLSFTAGKATERIKQKNLKIIKELGSILQVDSDKLVHRVNELIEKWKNVNKALKSGKINKSDFELVSTKSFKGDPITELTQILNLKKDEIPAKVEKLYKEWEEAKKRLLEIENLLTNENVEVLMKEAMKFNKYKLLLKNFENLEQNDLKNLSIKILKQYDDIITIFLNRTDSGITIMGMLGEKPTKSADFNIGNFIKDCVLNFGGNGGGRIDYGQGFIPKNNLKVQDVIDFIKNKLARK
jgi:alanyl-tRNA synthetase